jgi:hypothetical protein
MKKRRLFIITLILILLGLLWWVGKTRTSVSVSEIHASANGGALGPALSSVTGTALGSNLSAGRPISPIIGQPALNPTTGQMEVKINPALPPGTQMQMILDAQNGREIDAYGKVIDQFGTPVDGADVIGGTFVISPDGSGGQKFTTETNGQGLFSFTGLHGSDFGVIISKEGYKYNQRPYLDWFKGYKPDPANPMVFTMYKLQGAEPMVHIKFGRTIPCDGTEVQYNLLTGTEVSTGGDLIVSFIRDPVQIHRGKPFEWTLTLEVPGGGLIEESDPYPYEAPEGGYQNAVTVTTGPEPKAYIDSTTKSYYYKSADGKYGRLFINLQADFQPPPTSFDGSIYLNPSGSRNLEWDTAKQIKP